MLIVIALVLCLLTGCLAARKGYAFVAWVLAAGIPGLLVLAFLPFVDDGERSADAQARTRNVGNGLGGLISSLALMLMAVRVFG